MQRTHYGPAAMLLFGVWLLSGCTPHNPGEEAKPMTAAQKQQAAEKRIQDIQNDPNMPPIAKQQAIAQIQAHSGPLKPGQ
jgi:hypothetical protein